MFVLLFFVFWGGDKEKGLGLFLVYDQESCLAVLWTICGLRDSHKFSK